MSQKPVILLVAFGTAVESAMQVYDEIRASAQAYFPDYDIEWAYTSRRIIALLAERGIERQTPLACLDTLQKRGVQRVIIQPLYTVAGSEYTRLAEEVAHRTDLSVVMSRPLLHTQDDERELATVLKSLIDPKMFTIICAHGNDRIPAFNEPLLRLAEQLESAHCWFCSVEGQPGERRFAQIQNALKPDQPVHIFPFMITAGMHITVDVCGADAESWCSRLGITQPVVLVPLGAREEIRQLFWQRCLRSTTNSA